MQHCGRRRQPRTTSIHKNSATVFITIDLLAGSNHDLLTSAGVARLTTKGRVYWNRTSFVIDPPGALQNSLREGKS